ncbi:hypothetical protein SDC9_18422 [bioreactor metagenome]|uniref:Uncharacterized protein n=1 Tax=bioreactor metagenome TaxID=1076179 RepID=A0A644U078_9ZZZZ|nr:hypothetical protein [Methanocorpusculum sp.]
MTLEEKITFYSREDAAAFQKYLREKGCPSRISVEHSFSGTPYFEGTIASILHLIELIEAREQDADLDELKSDLLSRRKTLEEFFASHKAGDSLTEATPSQLLAQAESIDAMGEDVQKQASDKFMNALMILGTLEDNDLLEVSEEKECYTLLATKDPNELRVMYAYTDFSGVTEEDLKEAGITSHIRTSSATEYIITAGAELLFVSDIEDLADLLDHMDVEDDEAARFVDAVFFKQALIGKIHALVAEGKQSEADLLAALDAPAFPLEGTDDVISFDISAEYLSGVVSDLRKQGVLSGKDGKIKSS